MSFSDLEKNFKNMGLNPNMAMEGLKHLKPLNYWDYTEVETLLSLQKPRTHFPDEHIFIVYHQITELVFNLMLHELEQLCSTVLPSESEMITKVNRLCKYTELLKSSFGIMFQGMDYEQYNVFRHSLAPASGFQSAQYRQIEIFCTRIHNLAPDAPKNSDVQTAFAHIYWQHAGINRKTGKKSFTLRQFEDKYLEQFKNLAHKVQGFTLEEQLNKFKIKSEQLKSAARNFDHLYNVEWPLVHLETAKFYLNLKGENKAATGGSEWQKYLHPKYQRRIFFPKLWSKSELENWGQI